MPLPQKQLLNNDIVFQTCGTIMVAAKHNILAMSCDYCEQKFKQIQAFLRHLQLEHADKVEFGEQDKKVEVYAVEELMPGSQQSNAEADNDSEESGVAEDGEEDEGNWLSDEDKKWLEGAEAKGEANGNVNKKQEGLANMSILRAFEDCDVTLNFLDNLENTKLEAVEEGKEDEEEGEEEQSSDDEDGNDSILNNTLMQKIQKDLNVEEEENSEKEKNAAEVEDNDNEGDVTMTEETNENEEAEKRTSSKSAALKGLLQGLDDLEDVDGLLENLDDTIMNKSVEFIKPKVINFEKKSKKVNETVNNLEISTMEDLDITFQVENRQVSAQEDVINFKLTKKINKEKEKSTKSEEIPKKTQQKMVLNIESGELEDMEVISNESEDSLEENLIFNNFINKENKENTEKKDNPRILDLNLEDSIMEEVKLHLNKPELTRDLKNKSGEENFSRDLEHLNDKNSEIEKSKEINDLDFDLQLKNLEESLNESDETSKEQSRNNQDFQENLAINSEESDNEDFALQLKDLEDSLNNDNSNETVKSHGKFSNMKRKNLMKELDLEFSDTEEDFKQESKKISTKIGKNKQSLKKSLNFKEKSNNLQKDFKINKEKDLKSDHVEDFQENKEISSSGLNNDLTKALSDALEVDDLNLFDLDADDETNPPLNQNLKDLLKLELMETEEVEENNKEIAKKIPQKVKILKNSEKVAKSKTFLNQNLKNLLNQDLKEPEEEKSNEEIKHQTNFKNHNDKNVTILKKSEKVLKSESFSKQNLKDLLNPDIVEPKEEKYLPNKNNSNKNDKFLTKSEKVLKSSPSSKQNLNDLNKKETEAFQDLKKEHKLDDDKKDIVLKKSDKVQKSPSCETLTSRYQNTHLKAKTRQQNPFANEVQNVNNTNSLQFKQSKDNLKTKILSSQNSLNVLNVNLMENLQFKSSPSDLLKPKTPKKSKETQRNSNPRLRKTPYKENEENLTPDLIKQIKKEKFTPQPCFINTARGDRTPLKREEIFCKQSPKTQEKNENSLGNFTPSKDEKTPTTKEQLFLKQSPRSQEKLEQLTLNKTPKLQQSLGKTQEQIKFKQSPKTQEKNENQFNDKIQKTPGKINLQLRGLPALKITKVTKQIMTSPIKSLAENSNIMPHTTPRRTKNLAIKLPRLTPDKFQQINKTPSFRSTQINQPKTSPNQDSQKSFLQIENKTNWNNIKLPSGITLSRVSPSNNNNQSQLDETPIKTNYCKQNFTEASLKLEKQHLTNIKTQQEQIQANSTNPIINSKNIPNIQTTLIKPQAHIKRIQNTPLHQRRRQRKASIDIVPTQPKTSQNRHHLQNPKTTPKHSNLNYKSYSVNRTARKKEVLQRMRHIKKQIFKSIENGQAKTKLNQMVRSPLIQQRKRKIQIDNVQILPKLRESVMTPLINPFDKFKKPLPNNLNSTPPSSAAVSPKNLNDDEKQAKKSLEIPAFTSPINDDEKLIKKSLKRPATSPLQDDGKEVKRPFKSPSVEKKVESNKSSELESTQLGLSESVVDFLQRDLKKNRLNMDSFLNSDVPIDDKSPNETSMESNENNKSLEKEKGMETAKPEENILDDLLTQVDHEQKANETKSEDKKEANETAANHDLVTDFDEIKDLNLLSKFGLKIIKTPDLEDIIPLEEAEEIRENAKNFAEIYRFYQRIWCSKKDENPNVRQELDISFSQFLNHINQIYNLEFNMSEIKRLVNLITLWYVHHCNSKLIEKKSISEVTNNYLLMFNFIPKTAKRFYYCEYCEEYCNTEHKYFTHRIVHTGEPFPYKCSKCSSGFKVLKTLKTHEQQCVGPAKKETSDNNENNSEKSLAATAPAVQFKCSVCSKGFQNSQTLYEHSKTHLKTMYKCAKCEKVFASVTDVKSHMNVCNPSVKRIPKQSTPRPLKSKGESQSEN